MSLYENLRRRERKLLLGKTKAKERVFSDMVQRSSSWCVHTHAFFSRVCVKAAYICEEALASLPMWRRYALCCAGGGGTVMVICPPYSIYYTHEWLPKFELCLRAPIYPTTWRASISPKKIIFPYCMHIQTFLSRRNLFIIKFRHTILLLKNCNNNMLNSKVYLFSQIKY